MKGRKGIPSEGRGGPTVCCGAWAYLYHYSTRDILTTELRTTSTV